MEIYKKDFWKECVYRAVCTFAESILGVLTAGSLITEVDYKFVLASAGTAAVVTVLKCIVANRGNRDE